MATPRHVEALAGALRDRLPGIDPAFHFHNTRGLGLVGVLVALQEGIVRFESSVGGLGGCPFAPNAAGNVCTEDMVHMLHELGIETGLELTQLIAAARLAEQLVGRTLEPSWLQCLRMMYHRHLQAADQCSIIVGIGIDSPVLRCASRCASGHRVGSLISCYVDQA